MDFKTIAILGPGLLGGSLALSLRRLCPDVQVHLWGRRRVVIDEIVQNDLVDLASTDLKEVLAKADLVILTTPVGIMQELSLAIRDVGGMASGCIITDVGSVKEPVMQVFDQVFGDTDITCIGSHPMAGSEKMGMAHARDDLFEGACCVLTPPADSSEVEDAKLQALQQFWEKLGMRVRVMPSAEHDCLVARISHLPHLVAAAVVEVAFDGEAKATELAGTGFIDSTRIAAGAPEMWTEILMENRLAVMAELKVLQAQLGDAYAFLEEKDEENLMRFLSDAKGHRDSVAER
ncbi:MAG: prephenate dehydrogenase/arogenate dehydrogenase family protein [Verrucomicrobiales bacterium]|nr:prephenate dehydrogenase/arogenate dehydrogenase family protein [Verrucomicrobiales bacterium]